MVSTCSDIDDVYAVSSKLKPAKWHVKSKLINMLFFRVTCKDQMLIKYVIMQLK
jgi:hypothetical protein